MVPNLKRQWKKLVNLVEREPGIRFVRVLAINKLPNNGGCLAQKEKPWRRL